MPTSTAAHFATGHVPVVSLEARSRKLQRAYAIRRNTLRLYKQETHSTFIGLCGASGRDNEHFVL